MHTSSATPLERVHVEAIGANVSEVWLYDNIEEVTEGEATYYEADTVNGIVTGNPTVEEVEADFDVYWQMFERASMTDKERIAEAYAIAERALAQADFTAIMTDTEVGE